MATTTDKPSAAELRAQKEARVTDEQAKLAEARERAEREASEESATNGRRSRNGANVDPQDGLFDQVIENGDLEQALEDREKVKASRAALNAKFKEADDAAKGIIATLNLETDAVVRVGRFRLSLSSVEGRSVAFDTEPTERLSITVTD